MLKEIKSAINWFIDLLEAQSARAKLMFIIFAIIYIIAACKFWLSDIKFWYLTEPNETPEPPPFLNIYFWALMGASALALLVILLLYTYAKKFDDSTSPLKHLSGIFVALGCLIQIPLVMGLLFIMLYSIALGGRLLIIFGLIFFLAFWSAVLMDKLLNWAMSYRKIN